MIKSMTGYGTGNASLGDTVVSVEIKAVNSKFLDAKLYSPPEFHGLEMEIKKRLRQSISRGRVEVFLNYDGDSIDSGKKLMIDWALADQYFQAFQSFKERFGIHQDPNLSMLTGAKEVITVSRKGADPGETWKKLEPGFDAALKVLDDMRQEEGKALAIDLAGRCNLIRELTQKIAKIVPQTVEAYREKLEERIGAIAPQELDQNRLNQEVCYFTDRCDVSEEITRLKSHIQQFLRFLESSEPVGRRLDFLLQEMNRETNTVGSKSGSAEVSHTVVEIKGELEKLREQVQNVE